jgi:hypothetical protein
MICFHLGFDFVSKGQDEALDVAVPAPRITSDRLGPLMASL